MMTRLRATFADDSANVFVGYTDGRLWNGFACPHLPLAELVRVLEALVAWGDECAFEVIDDLRVAVQGIDGDRYVMEARVQTTIDGDRWLFDCGGAWTFIEARDYHVAVIDGAEPDDPDPMLVTDDDDQPLRFATREAADDWASTNYPAWLIEHHGNGHNWKSYGFRVVDAKEPRS